MGGSSRGPKPFKQGQVRTTFIRVPAADWAAVTRGSKTEFRSMGGETTALWRAQTPCPVVLYKQAPGGWASQLMVLEETWRERLIEMSPESIANEGFASFEEFRAYWMRRERRKFAPMMTVSVYRVRGWREEDAAPMAMTILERLYGEFL
jgi:hypothetical protein